jgi:hypothetical protein
MPKPEHSFLSHCLLHWVIAAATMQLLGCSSPPAGHGPTAQASAETASPHKPDLSTKPFDSWQHYQLPGKRPTEFSFEQRDGHMVAAAVADSSASMLRQPLRIEAADLGKVQFSWMVPELIAQADMAVRQSDDSPVRVVLAFEGERSKFSMKNAMLSELSLAITGEPLPYATLMYVWCNTRAPGSVIINPRTDRIRKLVVESGAQRLNQWLNYERDVRADFEKAFGEAPGALVGIGIMTDSDNTQTKTRAWYGPLHLTAGR